MTKREIAEILEEMAFFLELKGENPFKAGAYDRAARIIKSLPEEPAVLVQKGSLNQVKGIGPALAAVICDLVNTGACSLHQELKALFPSSLTELTGIPGLGPQKLRILYEQLGIRSLGELQYACSENRLVDLKGFGLKTQEKIVAGIRQFQRGQGFHLYGVVINDAMALLGAARIALYRHRIELAGDLRRRIEIVQDISMIVAGERAEVLDELVSAIPGITEIAHKASGAVTARSPEGVPVEITLARPAEFGEAWFVATGNAEHVAAVQRRLSTRGPFDTEEALYAAAGLPFIPPELREGHDEIALAEKGDLPVLVEPSQLQGIFHNHTVYSDGSATIEQMARAAQALGFHYIGISDHSQSAFYANGLKEDRILAQRAEMTAVQSRLSGIRIFKGIEADILVDGSLDYPDDVLTTFDFVIASVHSRFNLSEEEQTRRICRAMSHPAVTMLGHATGRLLLSRDGYRVDMKKVIDTAAAHGKLLEINASPHRMELDWRLCGYAKQQGARFSINPDAHSPEALTTTPLGVNVARKGGLAASDIINTLPVDKMAAYLQS